MFLQRGVLQPRKEAAVNFGCPPVYYDLIDIIMIRRGNDPSDEQILDYLNNLMKADLAGIRTYSNVE